MIAAGLCGVALLGGGCQKSDTKSEPGKPRVALVMKSLANEFFLTMEQGARDHQKAHAAEYDLLANGIKNELGHLRARMNCPAILSGRIRKDAQRIEREPRLWEKVSL